MKRKLEIIEETVKFYNSTNRAEHDGSCMYLDHVNGTGNKCAVGRCMTDEGIQSYGDYVGDVNDLLFHIGREDLDHILKDEYRGHGSGFWSDLQTLHDNDHFWNKKGLTKSGEEYYQDLINIYKNM